MDAWLGSKYASAYIHVQLSSMDIIYLFKIFAAVKYALSKKRRMK